LNVLGEFPQTLFGSAAPASKFTLELLFHTGSTISSLQLLNELVVGEVTCTIQKLRGGTCQRPSEVRQLVGCFPFIVERTILKLDQEGLKTSLAIKFIRLEVAAAPVSRTRLVRRRICTAVPVTSAAPFVFPVTIPTRLIFAVAA